MPYRPPAASPPKPPKQSGRPPAPSEVSTGITPPKKKRQPPPVRESRPEIQQGLPGGGKLTGPPIPALQKLGYFGSIHDVNQKVQDITDAFQTKFGHQPSPGLVFDVLRSPVQDASKLFGAVPGSTALGLAQNTPGKTQKTPMVPDINGNLVPKFYFGDWVHQTGLSVEVPGVVQKPHLSPQAQWDNIVKQKKSHPWVPVESGFLPIPGFFHFIDAVKSIQGKPELLKLGNQTEQDYQKQLDLATKQAVLQGSPETLHAVGKAERQKAAAGAVLTVKDGQKYLQGVAPEFFSELPVDGNLNADWAKAIRQWYSTGNYFRESTRRLSQESGFGNNTGTFVKAWKDKQKMIAKNPFAAHVISSISLKFFGEKKGWKAIHRGIFEDREGWHLFTPTAALHAVANTAKLGFDLAGGSWQQTKSDAAFTTTYLAAIAPVAFGQKGHGEEDARKHARAALLKNSTFLDIVTAGHTPESKGWQRAVDQGTNLMFDLVTASPRVLGTRVEAGNVGKLFQHDYFQSRTTLAWNALKKGDIAEASKSLDRGLDADRLHVRLEKQVQDGTMSLSEYQGHVAREYAGGKALFHPLRSYSYPTPGIASEIMGAFSNATRKIADDLDGGLRAGGKTKSAAADFLSSLRTTYSRAVPKEAYIFADKTPDDIYNFVSKRLGDKALANEYRNKFVRLRARDDISGISDLGTELRDRYQEKFPLGREGSRTPTGGPEIESESLSKLFFPSGRYKATQGFKTPFDSTAKWMAKRNETLNKWAGFHRRLIIGFPGLGEVLFWKHQVADTLRRMAGGGGPLWGDTRSMNVARGHVEEAFKANPELMRNFGAEQEAANFGEYFYMQGKGIRSPVTFKTGEHFDSGTHMEAAGGNLRHLVTDRAMLAYLQSTNDDLTPLVKFVKSHSFHRNKIISSEAYKEAAAGLEKKSPAESAIFDHMAQEYARELSLRYKAFEEAGKAAGLDRPLEQASFAMRESLLHPIGKLQGVNKADTKLGEFIKKHQINYDVKDGLVAESKFDSVTSWWTGQLMRANKWNRGKMFEHTFYRTVGDLRKEGASIEDSIKTATQVAKNMTVYHMLDFSNMLQAEQDFRWVSYFATKHRLYWTWIGKYFATHPSAAGAINDTKQAVDDKGNLKFQIAGHKFYIPLARLVWVNNKEYPETSPIFGALFKGGKAALGGNATVTDALETALASASATSGNIVTRDDQAALILAKLAGVTSGRKPATYGEAVSGLAPQQAQNVNREIIQYQLAHFQQHGDWATEGDAVRHALAHGFGMEFQRANMFVPVLPDTSKPSRVQKLFDQFGKIIAPKKKAEFLRSHPDLENWFNLNSDPELYMHNRLLWAGFNSARQALTDQQNTITERVVQAGRLTPKDANDLRDAATTFQHVVDKLRDRDAAWSGSPGFPKKIGEPGPWSQQLDGDPLATRKMVHHWFPEIPKSELNAHTVGQTEVDLENRLNYDRRHLKTLTKLGVDPQNVKSEISLIIKKLEVFRAYPKAGITKLERHYYDNFVSPYWDQREQKRLKSEKVPQRELDLYEAEFRAWRDSQDKPIVLNFKGRKITFPSPVKMGWLRQPDALFKSNVAKLAGDNYSHLANYEKELLGFKPTPRESEGWAVYTKIFSALKGESEMKGIPKLTPGQDIPSNWKPYMAHLIQTGDKSLGIKPHPNFVKAFQFSQLPKYQRVQKTDPVKHSQYREQWNYLFKDANSAWKAMSTPGYNKTDVEAAYRDYVNNDPGFRKWFDATPAGFRRELSTFSSRGSQDFLNTFLSQG